MMLLLGKFHLASALALSATAAYEYPLYLYSTEAFELIESLQKIAIAVASDANLTDTPAALAYPSKYPANKFAQVVAGDIATYKFSEIESLRSRPIFAQPMSTFMESSLLIQ